MVLSNCCNFAVSPLKPQKDLKIVWECRKCKRKLTDYGVYGYDFASGTKITKEDFEYEL